MTLVCENLLINIILFIIGVTILVKGSDWFVDAAAVLARRLGVPELVIGLTLVSIGTSLPELASSLCAAFYGEADFVIGNIVGSNIANIALILGGGLLLGGGLNFSRRMIWRDALMLTALGFGLMVWFYCRKELSGTGVYGIGRLGGVVLLLLCASYSFMLFKKDNSGTAADPTPGNETPVWSWQKAAGLMVLALIMIMLGAKLMVDTVVWGAEKMQINTLVISLTVVAIGTSLPELAVTISGVLKKREDIALGNIIGSGIYNILLIIGCCAAASPLVSDINAMKSMLIMNAVTLLLWFFMLCGRKLYRWQGALLLAVYVVFVLWSMFFVR